MNRLFTVLAAWACLLTAVPAAQAASIVFTHSGTGSGSLGAVTFADADFTITSTADTSAVQFLSPSVYFVDHTSSSIVIEGVGTFDFITATRTFVAQGGEIVGYSRGAGGLDLFNGPIDSQFGTWDMSTSIGPVIGDGVLLQWGSGDVETTGGVLDFLNSSTAAVFQAVVDAAPVPEPGSATLLGLGAFSLFAGVRLRRRFASAA